MGKKMEIAKKVAVVTAKVAIFPVAVVTSLIWGPIYIGIKAGQIDGERVKNGESPLYGYLGDRNLMNPNKK